MTNLVVLWAVLNEAFTEKLRDDVGANAKTKDWFSQLRKNVTSGRWDSQLLGVIVKLLCLCSTPSLTYSALWHGVGLGFASQLH